MRELKVSRASSKLQGRVAAHDAEDLCGTADAIHLQKLDQTCGSNPGLGVVTTSRGQTQARTYGLPTSRLYVCHPGSKVRGFLFSADGRTSINSEHDLHEKVASLFRGELWNTETSIKSTARLYFIWIAEVVQGRTASQKPAILWVLDKNGNMVFAPEVQAGFQHKHGDLTPGRWPWSHADDNTTSPYISNLGAYVEKSQSGPFRGPARAGGEMQFPSGSSTPVLHDRSGYSLDRVTLPIIHNSFGNSLASGSREAAKYVGDALSTSHPVDGIGQCGMNLLKQYWQESLKLPTNGAKFESVLEGKPAEKQRRMIILVMLIMFGLCCLLPIFRCCFNCSRRRKAAKKPMPGIEEAMQLEDKRPASHASVLTA